MRYKGIVLCRFRYDDGRYVAHVFTLENGRMSFLVPVSGRKGEGAMGALFGPLAMVGIEAEERPRGSLRRVREAWPWHVLTSIPYDPYKSGIAMFLSEFLCGALREEWGDGALFSYLSASIEWLDTCERDFPNFHLVFLMRLTRFLGFCPNTEGYTEGACFDLVNGCFTPKPPVHGMFLGSEESARMRDLASMRFDDMRLSTMDRAERNRWLDIMTGYYRLHLPGFREPVSLPILRELFA